MSDNIENTNNYLRLTSMYLDLGTETILELFLNLMSSEGYQNVSAFLHDETSIDVLSDLKKKGTLNKHEYNLVTAVDIVHQKFDITLLIKLISNLFCKIICLPSTKPQPKDDSVGAHLYRLRRFRNKLCHPPHAQMTRGDFEYSWDKISTSLLRVAQRKGIEEKEILNKRISEYKTRTLDRDDAAIKSRLHKLQEWTREKEVLQEKVEDLIKKLHVLKRTPKRYLRYIKLLLDGGRLVLLGILKRECVSAQKTLTRVLHQNQDALLREIINAEDISTLLPPGRDEADPSTWDISLIADVILISFSSSLSPDAIKKIGRIRDARNQYAATALSVVAQESDDLFEQSAILIHSLTSLSQGLGLETTQQLDCMIEQYPTLDIFDDDTIDKYLNELGKHGANIKSIQNLYKEIQVKIVTLCEDEKTKRNAEDKLEIACNVAIENDAVGTSLSPSDNLYQEVDTLIRRFSCLPDVKVSGIKRNCITLSLSCSSCHGILQVIDYVSSKKFEKTRDRIADELSYIYGDAFALRGNITLESICGVLKNPGNEMIQTSDGLSLAIECSSSEGIRHVLSLFGDNETTNSFNHISDILSSEYNEKVSVQGFPDLKELFDLYEESDTDTSGSVKDHDEDCRLFAEYEPDIENKVPPTYLEGEAHTLNSEEEKDIVHTKQINEEESQGDKKQCSEQDFRGDENRVLKEHIDDNELQHRDEDVGMSTTIIDVQDESQYNTPVARIDIKETFHILNALRNGVDKIKNEVVATAKEVSALYGDRTCVTVFSDESEHHEISTESILIEDKQKRSYPDHEKHDTSKAMSPSLLDKINESTYVLLEQALKQLKTIVSSLKDLVFTWKDSFKLAYVGLAECQNIDEIAIRCGRIGRNIHDLLHEIIPLLFNIHIDSGWATKELEKYEQKLESLLYKLVQSTFIVTEQDSCFIRLDGRKHLPVFTVRILAAESLPQHSDKIEAMLLSERDINDCCEGSDFVKLLYTKAKDGGLHLTSNKIYFTPTRNSSFRRMKLKDKYPRKQFDGGEEDYKVKCRTVFTTTLSGRQYWTLSLPMTMLNDPEPDQEFLANSSIMWQCYSVDVYNLPLQSDADLPWTKVEDIIQSKFHKLRPKTPLSVGSILYLKEMLFGTTDVPDSMVVSFEKFCIYKIESTSVPRSFWKWIMGIYKLIERYLSDFWRNGLILEFISKEDAETRLKKYKHAKHGTFILRFSEHHHPNEENVTDTFGQHVAAYVLTIREKNDISCLESSVYRTLGEYLDRNDNGKAEPRWAYLIKHCDIPIGQKEQRRIKKEGKPGSIFLHELEELQYKIPDLADMFREHDMHGGLDILQTGDVNEKSVLSVCENVFRKIGTALEKLHKVHLPDSQAESCWNYIINHDDGLEINRKDERNIGSSLKPGETFLDVFNSCGYTLKDLKHLCETYQMQEILDILQSNRQEEYLQKTLVDVDVGGEEEFRHKKLVDILKEIRSQDGCQMLKFLYPGEYTLEQLCEKYP